MLGAVDVTIFRFINKGLANPVFDKVMPVFSSIGTGIIILYAALFIIIFCKKENKLAGILLLAGLTATYYAVDHLKGIFSVPRPFLALTDVRVLATKVTGFSFPSGHSVTAFMAAAIVSRYFKSWTAVWIAIAVGVAFSRIYIGVHYASDVICGAFVGTLIGYILIKVSDNTNK